MKRSLLVALSVMLASQAMAIDVKSFARSAAGWLNEPELTALLVHFEIDRAGLTFADLDTDRDLALSNEELSGPRAAAMKRLAELRAKHPADQAGRTEVAIVARFLGVQPVEKDFMNPQGVTNAFVHHRIKAFGITFEKLDANADLRVGADEMELYRGLSEVDLETFKEKHKPLDESGAYRLADVQRFLEITQGGPSALWGILRVRETADLPLESSFAKAKPAKLTYARDLGGNTDTWVAKGAVIAPWEIKEGKPAAFSRLFFTPSVSVDRINNQTDAKKEKDDLVVRAGMLGEWTGATIERSELRLNLAYATDSRFDSRVDAAELEWEPADWYALGIGVAQPVIRNVLERRWRAFAYLNYGEVKDAGRKELEAGDRFLRAGSLVGLDLLPLFWNRRLTLFATWRYMTGLRGDIQKSDLFEAGANWQLDAHGQFSIEYKYADGSTPLVEQDVRSSTVGLGVKF